MFPKLFRRNSETLPSDNDGRQTKRLAFFAAVSAFLGVFESFIPSPVPFFRIGLSNIPVMLALEFFSFPQIAYIVFFKVIVSHLFRGSLLSLPFFVGLSGNVMYLLFCYPFYAFFKKHISFVSVSVLSALVHNIAQMMIALLFLPAKTVWLIGCFLIIVGLVTGVLTGLFSNMIYNKYLINGLPD